MTRRQFPHVGQVQDRDAAQSLRLLWDRVFAVEDARTADAATIAAQATTISGLSSRLSKAERTIASLALQIKAAGASGGGSGDLTDPPITGEIPANSTQTFAGLGAVSVYASGVVDAWTEVGTLSATFTPGRLLLSISALASWSANPINIGGATQAATIWLFLQIGGSWVGAAGERLRPNQTTKDENTLYSLWPGDWFYNPTIWGPLSGYVPTPGQPAALMVAAGSTRVDSRTNFTERTPVVQFAWPADGATLTIP